MNMMVLMIMMMMMTMVIVMMTLQMYLAYRLEATIHHIMFWHASAAPVVNTLVLSLEHLASEASIFTSNFSLMTSVCFHLPDNTAVCVVDITVMTCW